MNLPFSNPDARPYRRSQSCDRRHLCACSGTCRATSVGVLLRPAGCASAAAASHAATAATCSRSSRRRTRPRSRPSSRENPAQRNAQGEHLAGVAGPPQQSHPPQQQQALEQEPGFHDLPAQTQQRMRERLTQLNAMPPAAARQVLARTEAMEQLTPEQRSRCAAPCSSSPRFRRTSRRAVQRSLPQLRDMPPAQRESLSELARHPVAVHRPGARRAVQPDGC